MSIQAFTYVLEHSEAQHGARCMMFAIANHADEHGENCWASVATLSHEARLSRRGAQEALAQLRADGEIEAMGTSRFQTVVYRIVGLAANPNQVPLLGTKEGSAESAHPKRGSAESSTGGAQNPSQRGAESAPKPSLTAHETTTPLAPQRGEGQNRERDRERLRADRYIWAAQHFPAYPRGAVCHAIEFATRRTGEATVEAVRAELERMAVEPQEAAAA